MAKNKTVFWTSQPSLGSNTNIHGRGEAERNSFEPLQGRLAVLHCLIQCISAHLVLNLNMWSLAVEGELGLSGTRLNYSRACRHGAFDPGWTIELSREIRCMHIFWWWLGKLLYWMGAKALTWSLRNRVWAKPTLRALTSPPSRWRRRLRRTRPDCLVLLLTLAWSYNFGWKQRRLFIRNAEVIVLFWRLVWLMWVSKLGLRVFAPLISSHEVWHPLGGIQV